MKNGKRILSVTIRHITDESPDTSYIGEYSQSPKTEFAIDRAHSEDCAVNQENPTLWFTSSSGRIEFKMTLEQARSVSHSGECDADVLALSRLPEIKEQLDKIDAKLLSDELREYGSWSDSERQDHAQNIQRLLWLAGGDITDNPIECDCGERGDMLRGEYRYFNPGSVESFELDASWIPAEITDIAKRKEYWRNEMRKNARLDYERMEELNANNWCYIGIRVDAEIGLPCGIPGSLQTQKITSGGLWGIESDSDKDYFAEIEREQLSELRDQLRALGFSTRAISTAFKDIKRKDY